MSQSTFGTALFRTAIQYPNASIHGQRNTERERMFLSSCSWMSISMFCKDIGSLVKYVQYFGTDFIKLSLGGRSPNVVILSTAPDWRTWHLWMWQLDSYHIVKRMEIIVLLLLYRMRKQIIYLNLEGSEHLVMLYDVEQVCWYMELFSTLVFLTVVQLEYKQTSMLWWSWDIGRNAFRVLQLIIHVLPIDTNHLVSFFYHAVVVVFDCL